MKAYTDLSQSKKLAKILPIESADMTHRWFGKALNVDCYEVSYGRDTINGKDIPCWSLTALLEVLPEYNLQRTDWGYKTEYKIVVTINDEDNYASKNYDNPLDACVDVILKLKERNLI